MNVIQAYYTDAKSELTYDGLGGLLDARPVQSVIVLTPDIMGEGKGAPNINTRIKTLKPDGTNETLANIMHAIEEGIDDRVQKCGMVEKWRSKVLSTPMA